MTRFEKIKQNLTIEQVVEYLNKHSDGYCYDMCEKHTGNKYKCPYAPVEDCHKCAIEWLSEEVSDTSVIEA